MASGAFSNSALATWPHGSAHPDHVEDQHLAAKISRARMSGPSQITKDATVAEMNHDGTFTILHQGTKDWICCPGNENEIGNVPMCMDKQGVQWAKDIMAKAPAPTNTAPGLIYMLCGATQHSNTDPFDRTSSPIPIGPHWMIIWPYDSNRDGIPSDVRDSGAWVMFDGTPYAYLHICGTPWAGNSYHPEKCPNPIWTMQYGCST